MVALESLASQTFYNKEVLLAKPDLKFVSTATTKEVSNFDPIRWSFLRLILIFGIF